LTASGGTSYAWSNGTTTASLSNVTANGTYTVTVSNNGCTSTASKVVSVTPLPVAAITASGTTALCAGGSVSLTASGGTNYAWSNGVFGATLQNLTTGGNYTVTVSNGSCTSVAAKNITVSPVPVATITASGATTFCQGSSVNLTASGGTIYNWSNGATTATLSNITTAGKYTVTVSNGNCTATAVQNIAVSSTPIAAITASGATAFCQGGSVNLTASGGTNYAWSNGATTATISNITTSGSYVVTISNGNCTTTGTQNVTITPLPVAKITASGLTTFCTGGSVNLTASGGTAYAWSNGATTAKLSNVNTAATYTVTVSDGACKVNTSLAIVVNIAPPANITASGATALCTGGSVSLTASGGVSYLWSTGATTATLTNLAASNNYIVTVTGSNGCKSTATQSITMNPMPTATITASGPITTCEGSGLTLTATGGTAYAWSTGATTATISNLTISNMYVVTVTNGGCSATAIQPVTVMPAPSVVMTSTASNGTNGTATAKATGGKPPYIYDWNNNATNYTLIGLDAGIYTVTVTDANGCTKTAEIEVSVYTKTNDVAESIKFNINPVPNDGHFTLKLELPSPQTIHIGIYSLIGQKMVHKILKGQSISEPIDISQLNNGQYLVTVNTDSGVATKWIVVNK
jgi:Secretion system C-terminal sorting domain